MKNIWIESIYTLTTRSAITKHASSIFYLLSTYLNSKSLSFADWYLGFWDSNQGPTQEGGGLGSTGNAR